MGRTARLRRKKKKGLLLGTCTINLSHDTSLINLISWLKTHKWKPFSSLHPTDFPSTGRGLMAGKRISVNDVLVQIPLGALITSKTVDESDIGQKLALKALLSQEILAAFLISEKHKKTESKWAPYIFSLPSDFSTPIYLSFPTLEFLPDFMQRPISEGLEAAHRSFLRLRELFPSLQEDEFQWAWSCVNTRAVYLPKPLKKKETFQLHIVDRDCLALAPYLDLFNHSNNVSVEVRVTPDGYELLTHTPYKQYDQVFISYGPHANLKLFLEYGFALPGNPHDSLPLRENDLLRAAGINGAIQSETVEAKIKLLQSQGLINSAALNREGVTWSAEAAIRLLKARNSNPQGWLDVLYNDSTDESDAASLNTVAIIAHEMEESLHKCSRQLEEYFASNSAVIALRSLVSELQDVAHTAHEILLKRSNL